jgi:hypothetical protein
MSDPLADARHKLGRAEVHLAELAAELRSIGSESDAYSVTLEKDDEPRRWTIWGERRNLRPEVALIVGDCVHNLRSSLDYLVWPLTNRKGKRKAGFPTVMKRSHWYDASAWMNYGLTNADAIEVIHRFQPYHSGSDPEQEPLGRLNILWNHDKHQRLLLTGYYYPADLVELIDAEGVTDFLVHNPGPADKRRKLVSFALSEDYDTFDLNHALPLHVSVEVGDQRINNVDQFLRDVHELIRDEIVPAFEPLFV